MKTNYLVQSLFAGTTLLVALLPGNASVLTSFETDEGFVANSRTNTAGWTFSNNTRVRISNGTTEPALLGEFSFRAEGGSTALSGANTNWADREDQLNFYSFSFISPDAAFTSSTATVAWVYIFLYDETLQSNRAIQLWARYGNTSANSYRIQYTLDNGSGASTTAFTNINQAAMDFENWNTISADFNFDSGTYSIALNDNTVVNNILLPTDWNVNAIVGTQLVTPASGFTTYYDAIIAIPEPSAAQMLGFLGMGFLIVHMRRRICRAS